MCIITGSALAIAGAVATLASTAVGAVSAIQSGKAKAAQYQYQAKVAQDNAKIARQNAAQERQSGLEDARIQRMKTLQTIGSQQVAMAANGIDVTSGTALDTIEDSAQMGELDALMIEYNAERKAQNYEQTANNYLNQSNLDLLAARNAKREGTMTAISTGLQGIGNLGLDYGGTISSSWKNVKNSWNNRNLYSGGLKTDTFSTTAFA